MNNGKTRLRTLLLLILVPAILLTAGVPVSAAGHYDRPVPFSDASLPPEGSELIENGDFSGINPFHLYTESDGSASMKIVDDALQVDIGNVGWVNYAVQIFYTGFQLEHGTRYLLRFDISSTVQRDIDVLFQHNGDDYQTYYYRQVSAGQKRRTVELVFVMKDPDDPSPSLCFNLGCNAGAAPGDAVPHTVCIDNVSLTLINRGETDGTGQTEGTQPLPRPPVGTELVNNGTFSVSTPFDLYTGYEGSASINAVGGEMMVDIGNVGQTHYAVQPFFTGFQLEKGAICRLRFDARSSIPRDLEVRVQRNGDDYRAYCSSWLHIDENSRSFEYCFVMRSDEPTPSLCVNLGRSGDMGPNDAVPHQVFFDNFSLTVVGWSDSAEDNDWNMFTNLGSAYSPNGTNLVVSIFLSDPEYQWIWNENDVRTAKKHLNALSIACSWISEQARNYGADPVFYYDWSRYPDLIYETTVRVSALGDRLSLLYAVQGFIHEQIDTKALLTRYSADNIVYLIYINTPTDVWYQAFTWPMRRSRYVVFPNEICILYGRYIETPSIVAHEILHCYGAKDLYKPDNAITQEYVDYLSAIQSNDIMKKTTYDLNWIPDLFSEVDAYYTGLINYSEEVERWGLGDSDFIS